jgi:murein DD-endopeptidase MepM/ murein hydrolase activator NlpD
MIKPKSRMIEPTSEAAASEVFAIADNIIPIRVASVDVIMNTDFTEEMEVVPESQVKTLIIQNKTTNPMSKFFVRVGTYLDSLESFLNELDANYIKSIEQKNEIVQNEKTDQFLRTYKAKKTARKLSEEKKKNKKPLLDIGDPDALSMIALNMGLQIVKGIGDIKDMILGPDVPYEAIKGKLIPYGSTGGQQVSGYSVSSVYGMRLHPIYGDYRLHGGADVGVPSGTMFALKAKSKVVYAGADTNSGYGNVVEVYVPDLRKMFRFAHLSSIAVKKGEELEPGSVLGKAGSSGLSTGVHFHIETHSDYVEGTDHQHYGHEDPAPSLGYVILGNELQQKAEGSIERIGKVMVGEAGEEFVVPMSQMPIFAHLMMEEKIKCLIPEYLQPFNRFPDIGFERLAGTSDNKYAIGGILENHKVAARKLTQFFPGKPHVVAGIMGNLEHEAPGLKPDTYQYGGGPGRGIAQWEVNHAGNNFKGRWPMAVRLYGENVINSLPNQLDFIKWELDTSHVVDEQSRLPSGYATKKYVVDIPQNIHEATKNFMYDFERPDSIAQANWETERFSKAMFFMKNMNVLLAKEPEPKPETKAEEKPKPVKPRAKTRPTNIKEALWDFGIVPGLRDAKKSWGEFIQQFAPKDRSSLNNIPGNEQMEIASESQDQFSFDNAKGEIASYKPTVYYSDPA